jgi:hypothetical protein
MIWFALLTFESFLSTQIASVLEHVTTQTVQRPEAAFAWFVGRTRHLDETVVETQRMPNRVLPSEWKASRLFPTSKTKVIHPADLC